GGKFTWKKQPFVLPKGGRKFVFVKASGTRERMDFHPRHRAGFHQEAKGKRAPAENVRLLNPADRRKSRLDESHQIIRYLVRLKNIRSKTQVRRSKLRICGLNGDDWNL